MALGSLSSLLEIRSAESFRGSSVLAQSYPLTGYTSNLTPPSPPFTPTDITGLRLWLDASALTGLNNNDSVSSWTDLSGNSYNFTQATGSKQPLYKTSQQNGKPGIYFDGVDDALSNISGFGFNGASTQATLVVIYKAAANSYSVLRTPSDLTGLYWRYSGDGNGYWGPFVNGGRIEQFPTGMPASGVAAIVVDYSSNTGRRVRINTNGQTNANTAWIWPSSIVMGPSGSSGGPSFTGNVFEVLLYNTSLAVSDIQKIESYANSKWAIY